MNNITNKFVHTGILAVFGFGSVFTWLLLTHGFLRVPNQPMPGFSSVCMSLRPLVIALPILAAIYCLWVWFRKADRVPSWVGFFAVTTAAFVLVTFPVTLGAYFSLLSVVAGLPAK
jgi:hypothetical protein